MGRGDGAVATGMGFGLIQEGKGRPWHASFPASAAVRTFSSPRFDTTYGPGMRATARAGFIHGTAAEHAQLSLSSPRAVVHPYPDNNARNLASYHTLPGPTLPERRERCAPPDRCWRPIWR